MQKIVCQDDDNYYYLCRFVQTSDDNIAEYRDKRERKKVPISVFTNLCKQLTKRQSWEVYKFITRMLGEEKEFCTYSKKKKQKKSNHQSIDGHVDASFKFDSLIKHEKKTKSDTSKKPQKTIPLISLIGEKPESDTSKTNK